MEAFIYTTSDNYLKIFENKNTKNLIANIDGNLESVHIGNQDFVCFAGISNRNSYVCSLSSAYVHYALDELSVVENKTLRFALKIALNIAKPLFYFAKVENCVFLNNLLFSTSFFAPDFSFKNLEPQNTLLQKYKNKLLCIRNINEQNKQLYNSLEKNGWKLLPSRVVYMFYYKDLDVRKKKNHYKKDMSLLQKTNLTLQENNFTDADFERMQVLFEKLYLEKHSYENPNYKADFIKHCFKNSLLDICAYKMDNEIVAFIAIFEMQGTLSTPMLGYDTALPKELGLYRILCAKLHEIASVKHLDINFSSGAGEFKKARGGVPTKEYTAIYFNHLPFVQRLLLTFLSSFLQKYEKLFFQTIDADVV